MKKIALVVAVLLAAGAMVRAQDRDRQEEARALIAENPDRAGANMHSYEFSPVKDTPAPRGYKPFYISHYGRHGSRYEQNSTFSVQALAGFRVADSLNLLNERGKALRAAVQAITDEHKGMEGALSPRGGREHQQLAARMVARFPKVFRSKDRKEVSAVASTVQRCIVSMANFTGMLNQKAPGMDFSYTSGERFMELMHPPIAFPRGPVPGFGPSGEAQPAPSFDFSRFYGQIFNAPSKAMEAIPDAEGFVRSVFNTAILCQDLDFMDLDILRSYFTIDELMFLWPRMNNIIYLLWGNSLENGEAVQAVVKPLLRDIVTKADEALRPGSHRAADLRFGHDVGVLPLFALLGRDDAEGKRYPFNEAHKYWFSFERVPMASTFQMILYRNSKGDVLAKILNNEQEEHFPDLTPVSGPYYHWTDLREWLLERCR